MADKNTDKRRKRNEQRRKTQSKKSRSRPKIPDYSVVDPKKIESGPDLIVDVPVVKVDKVGVEIDDLRAQVAVIAEVKRLAQLSVGAEARLGKGELEIEGVEAQALLRARLDNVQAIVDRVALTLDRNPELLAGVGRAAEDLGAGSGELLGSAGDVAEDAGEGAEQALPQIGQGANQALGDVGQGAAQGVGQLGQGVGQGVGDLGQGAGQGVGQLGQGAGQGVGQAGQGVGQGLEQLAGQGAQGGKAQGGNPKQGGG